MVTIGVVAIAATGAGYFLSRKVALPHVGQHYHTWAMFRDGSRLPIGSAVMIAGVRVGEIDGLAIERGMAHVSMLLRDDTVLWSDAWAAKKAASVLGDNYIELSPGGPTLPNATDPAPDPLDAPQPLLDAEAPLVRIHSGEPIPRVVEGSSTDRTLRQIEAAMPRADRALAGANQVLDNAREWTDGPFATGVQRADDWVAAGNIENPLDKAARGMTALDNWTIRVQSAVQKGVPKVDRGLNSFDTAIIKARKDLVDARVSLQKALTEARAKIDEVDPYLIRADKTLAEYNGSAPETEGQLAKLINRGDLGKQLDELADDTADATASFDRLKSYIGFSTEYYVGGSQPRFYIGAQLAGRHDTFYQVEFEHDGFGQLPSTQLTDSSSNAGDTRTQEIKEGIRFGFQWGKRFGRLDLRVGIKDSVPGVGADVWFIGDKLKLSSDVYGSTFSTLPRVKLAAALRVFRSIYILAGVDDVLSSPGELPIASWPASQAVPVWFQSMHYGREVFVGFNLTFTDADLATLLRVYGGLLVSSLL